jgi:hypothetical protein
VAKRTPGAGGSFQWAAQVASQVADVAAVAAVGSPGGGGVVITGRAVHRYNMTKQSGRRMRRVFTVPKRTPVRCLPPKNHNSAESFHKCILNLKLCTLKGTSIKYEY